MCVVVQHSLGEPSWRGEQINNIGSYSGQVLEDCEMICAVPWESPTLKQRGSCLCGSSLPTLTANANPLVASSPSLCQSDEP